MRNYQRNRSFGAPRTRPAFNRGRGGSGIVSSIGAMIAQNWAHTRFVQPMLDQAKIRSIETTTPTETAAIDAHLTNLGLDTPEKRAAAVAKFSWRDIIFEGQKTGNIVRDLEDKVPGENIGGIPGGNPVPPKVSDVMQDPSKSDANQEIGKNTQDPKPTVVPQKVRTRKPKKKAKAVVASKPRTQEKINKRSLIINDGKGAK